MGSVVGGFPAGSGRFRKFEFGGGDKVPGKVLQHNCSALAAGDMT